MSHIADLRIARWERIKQAGILRFVLLRGVLGWGLFTAILVSVVTLTASERPPIPMSIFLPLIFGFFLVGGAVWGLAMWFFTMWHYSRALHARDNHNSRNA